MIIQPNKTRDTASLRTKRIVLETMRQEIWNALQYMGNNRNAIRDRDRMMFHKYLRNIEMLMRRLEKLEGIRRP